MAPTFSPTLMCSKHHTQALERTSDVILAGRARYEPSKHPMMAPTFSPTLLRSKNPLQTLERTSDAAGGCQDAL